MGSSLRSETRGDVWLALTLGLLSSEARKGAERLSPWELLSNLKGPEGEKGPTGPRGWERVGEIAASSPPSHSLPLPRARGSPSCLLGKEGTDSGVWTKVRNLGRRPPPTAIPGGLGGSLSSTHPPTAPATRCCLGGSCPLSPGAPLPAQTSRLCWADQALTLSCRGPQGPNSLLRMVGEGAMTQRITSPSHCLQPLLPMLETPLYIKAHWRPQPPR